MIRGGAVLLAVAAVALAALAGVAAAADECRGLQVCLPLGGPWVVIQPAAPGSAARADWDLRCPRRGYIVAGTDVRISDRQVDVGIRGETGSPVGPGTTTRESVLFTGLYAGGDRRRVAFRPFIGCIPTSGGGARSQTARTAGGEGLEPTRPVSRVLGERRLPGGITRATVRCPGASRLVDWSHAVGFDGDAPPSAAVLGSIASSGRATGNTVVVTASVKPAALASGPVLQIRATCTRAGR